eukprot:TRINITY_DN10074_c0_g2_i3.p1 TRINITY_DN10074_c0_g2~~TRINITY_DN10074_c0_g2_i3.p1  ORF type:complete len:363 (-),score=98.02 TRINITY_DN10074_c0_g2_i3:384-1472(-)
MSSDDENLQLIDKKTVKSGVGCAESKMAAGGGTGAAAKTTDAGLKNVRALLFLFLWYFFSGCTLFLNKYILSYRDGDATLLGSMQMILTLACGYLQMYYPCGMGPKASHGKKPAGFYRHMIIIGGLRFATVLLGLIALNFVAVSFTETVKSSAPAFTVIISRIILGSKTGLYVKLSLIPVMGGLALCSANELSYNLAGFVAALATNISECCQNVYSKMLISGEAHKYTPAELQFYTSVASLVVTVPTCCILMDWNKVTSTTDSGLAACLLLNGIFFHFQTISAYVLMDYISPVTHSVANTGKRAFLIWTSVILFGNEVTLLSGLGTLVVILGVLLYNQALAVDGDGGGGDRKRGIKSTVQKV